MSEILQKCSVCGALIDDEDLFCANCGTEAPHSQPVTAEASTVTTHNFVCGGCGASMSYDASVRALRCPFCGRERLESQVDSKTLAPRRVVPFRLERVQAEQVMRQHLGRGFWKPADLGRLAELTRMTPVYVPYWVFQASTHTYWTADSGQTPPGARSDWHPRFGEHHGVYRGLLVGASGALTPAETYALCPFDLAGGVAPDQVDLHNATVERFAVQRKYARPLARQSLEAMESAAVRQRYLPGACRNLRCNVRVQGLSSEPVLLPVWIMTYRYKNRLFRFLVNGQTGKASGDAPTSLARLLKILLVVAAVGIALFLLLLALGR